MIFTFLFFLKNIRMADANPSIDNHLKQKHEEVQSLRCLKCDNLTKPFSALVYDQLGSRRNKPSKIIIYQCTNLECSDYLLSFNDLSVFKIAPIIEKETQENYKHDAQSNEDQDHCKETENDAENESKDQNNIESDQ